MSGDDCGALQAGRGATLPPLSANQWWGTTGAFPEIPPVPMPANPLWAETPLGVAPPARIVAVDGGWVYLDDGTVWAASCGAWYEVMPPLPGTATQRQREAAG